VIGKDFTAAVVAVPSTMLVVGTMAGITAQVTHGDRESVKRAVYTSSVVLVTASLVTKRSSVIAATVLSVAAVIYITHPIWFKEVG